MTPPLSYAYDSDWRFRIASFRSRGSDSDFPAANVQDILFYGCFGGMCVALAYLGFIMRKPWMGMLLSVFAAFLLINLVFRVSVHSRLVRMAMFSMRNIWRAGEARQIRVEINEAGIREFDNHIESMCPWREVRHFTRHPKLLVITLSNGMATQVPDANLKAGSSSVEDLVAWLERQGIARKPPVRGRSPWWWRAV